MVPSPWQNQLTLVPSSWQTTHEVIPYVRDGLVEALDSSRSRLQLGAWSWAGLAATLARWDADIEVVSPAELRAAFADLADRAKRAAGSGPAVPPLGE